MERVELTRGKKFSCREERETKAGMIKLLFSGLTPPLTLNKSK